MKEIEKGEFFPLNSSLRKEGIELVIKSIKKGFTGKAVILRKLDEEVYSNKSDAKDFLKNLQKSSNHEIYSDFDKVKLGSQIEVRK